MDYIDTAIALVPEALLPTPYAKDISNATAVLVVPTSTITYASLHSYGLAEHDIYGNSRVGVKNYWPD